MAGEYRIMASGDMVVSAFERLMHELGHPKKIVEKYVQLMERGPELTHDSVLKHRAELTALEYLLPGTLPDERIDAYMWMVKEKHQAQESERYERAAVLRDTQRTLESKLFPFKNDELYMAVEAFMETKGWNPDKTAWEYEKTLLDVWEISRESAGIVPNAILSTVFAINLLRRLGPEITEEFNEYFAKLGRQFIERMRLRRIGR